MHDDKLPSNDYSKTPLLTGGWPLLINRLRARLFRRLILDLSSERRGLPRLPLVPGDMVSEISFVDGLYEITDIVLVLDLVQRGAIGSGVALDIGANIGNHSLAFAQVFYEVIAFEPFEASYHLLRAAVALNGAQNVIAVEMALGAQNGRVQLVQPGDDLGGVACGVDEQEKLNQTKPNAASAQVVRGDDWLDMNRPDIASGATRVSFIKIDVEGFESAVISGLLGLLSAQTPVLMIESLDAGAFERFSAPLRSTGYDHFYAIRVPRTGGGLSRFLRPSPRKGRLEPLVSAPTEAVNVIASTRALPVDVS